MMIRNSDISRIINESLKTDTDKRLNESLVAQEKQFNLATEFQSGATKKAHEGLYQKYLETFNRISAELDTADRSAASSNGSVYRSLKEDETYNMNAVYLHELYFANISDLASNIGMDSLTFMRFSRDFGDFDKWQNDFIACCLSSRCGWAITYYNIYTQTYMNTFMDLHSLQVPVGCIPVLVMDVWQHAYYKDYLSDVKTYTYAMMKEINWSTVEERVKRAEKIAVVIKGGM
jgi:Fe-Mn family superoxide dismutase